MEIIPLIYVNNDNVLDSKGLRVRDWNKFMEHMNNVYVFDIGGMKRNKPSLELYQRIGEYAALWVDASPRRFEDVMDVVVAGAEKVTIRKPFSAMMFQRFLMLWRWRCTAGLMLRSW